MKKQIISLFFAGMLIINGAFGQNDSTKTNSSTTTTTTTTTSSSSSQNAAAGSGEQVQPSEESGGGDFSSFYIGARFMPTATKFEINTVDNGVVKTSFVVGYGVGGFIGVNFSKHVGVQAEVIYSALSQKFTENNVEKQIDLNYVHVPLLLSLNTDVSKSINLNVSVGPQIGINTGSKLNVEGSDGVDTVNAVLAVKPADLGIAYGAGLDFKLAPNLSLGIGFRGVYGIIDVSDQSKSITTSQYYVLDRSHVKTYAGYAGITFGF